MERLLALYAFDRDEDIRRIARKILESRS